MLAQAYQLIMDPESNALNSVPKTVRFKLMMMLAFMWCSIFTVWTGWLAFYGPSVLAHILILIGVFFTADIFARANSRLLHHRDAMRNPSDGTALYDDLWGG